MMPACGRRARGFTFIELLMTLAILGVLVMVAAPMTEVVRQRQREHELRLALIQIREAIDAYKRATEQGRILLKLSDSGYPPNLDVLVQGVADQRSPTRQLIFFLRRLPADPFNESEQANSARSWGIRSYASGPDDPKEGADVYDVYSKSQALGLNGVPYRRW